VLGHTPGSHTFQGGLLLDLELKEQQLASNLADAYAAAHVLNSMMHIVQPCCHHGRTPPYCCSSWLNNMVTAYGDSTPGTEQSSPAASHHSCLPTIYVNIQATKQQHRSGKIMLEGWVDDVLTNSPWLQQQQHTSTGSVRGAVAAGLSRKQLLAAGLSVGAVEQLHRCLYVYSMGFVDTVKVRCTAAATEGMPELDCKASFKTAAVTCASSCCHSPLPLCVQHQDQLPRSVCSWCHGCAGAARSE
jgi:hypothetical protein